MEAHQRFVGETLRPDELNQLWENSIRSTQCLLIWSFFYLTNLLMPCTHLCGEDSF